MEKLTAAKGWLAIGALVLAHEYFAPEGELLSEGVDRAIEKHRFLAIGAVVITAAHLINVLPESIDPYHQSLQALRRHQVENNGQ